MHPYPVRLTCHVRACAFGRRPIPKILDKKGVPEGTVTETWKVSDYRETIGNSSTSATIENWIFAVRTPRRRERVGLTIAPSEATAPTSFVDAK